MEELRILGTEQLIDLLAKYTIDYTKMMSDGLVDFFLLREVSVLLCYDFFEFDPLGSCK